MKNRVTSSLLNAYFGILNIATSCLLVQKCRVIYKTYTAFIRTSPHSTNVCANSKIPIVHQS